jgi:hypothetical protein
MTVHFRSLFLNSVALLILFGTFSTNAAAQTDYPVALHAGAVYSRLPVSDFEVVQSIEGQELFSQIDAREDRLEFAALVSQRVWASQSRGYGIYGTLGTALNHPGSVLYLGGSVGVRRTLVTVGASTATIQKGINPVPDQVFRGVSDRSLFAGLDRERKWGLLIGVSFVLFE